jgi:3-dehydroquinate dehydratase-1
MQIVRMSPKKKPRDPAALVVATAHSAQGLQEASALRRGQVGFVEVRLDELTGEVRGLNRALPRIRVPILVTARHPSEGGAGALTATRRRALLEQNLHRAAAVDVELRSATALAAVLDEAARRRVVRVVSFHDFRRTPDLPRLRDVVRKSARAGADIVKIATYLRDAKDLVALLILQAGTKVPLATMGMGPLGKVSRLVLAATGSRLNYGYLDKPQVKGQWPALELARRLGEVMP